MGTCTSSLQEQRACLQAPTQLSYSCPPTLTASSLLGRRQGLQRWLGFSKLAFFLYHHFTLCGLINPEKWHKHVGQIFCSRCRKHSLEWASEEPELLSMQASFVPGRRNDTWTPGMLAWKWLNNLVSLGYSTRTQSLHEFSLISWELFRH